jgi:hypothetical protein
MLFADSTVGAGHGTVKSAVVMYHGNIRRQKCGEFETNYVFMFCTIAAEFGV